MTDATLPRPGAYAPHRLLSGPAEARPQLWRLILGVVFVGIFAFLCAQAIVVAIAVLGPDGTAGPGFDGSTPGALVFMLGAMGLLGLGTFLAARLIHKRPALSIVGPPGLAARQFGRVFVAMSLLSGLGLGLMALGGGMDLQRGLPLGTWAALLPVSLLVILVQTGSEELFFRGYLQSQLAARFASPVIWIGVPSVIFAAGHYAATFGSNALFVAGWAGLFGLLAADLTARAGTLGPAIALHLVNNATVLLFVSMQGPMSGLALYQYPFSPADAEEVAGALPFDVVSLLVGWGVARLAIRR